MEDRISKVVEELHEKDWGLIESINSDKLRLATRDRILRVFKGQEKFLEGLFIAIHKDGTLYDSLKSEMERKDELEKLERELAPILKLINGIEENIESLNNLHNETYSQLKREEAAECILHDIRERYP
jgi:predicted  nucleic acid-binding Zn-ribbon protein